MNFRTLNTIIVITVALAVPFESYAMIVGSSCLTRKVEKQKQNKLILLYERSANDSDDIIKISHIKDMKKFISAVGKRKETVSFLLEMSESDEDVTPFNNLIESPGDVAIKLALENNMQYKNITFIPFDVRKQCDWWMIDMIVQKDQFVKGLLQSHQYPSHFYDVTPKKILDHLKLRYNTTRSLIQQLPISQEAKKEDFVLSKNRYEDCDRIIRRLLKIHTIDEEDHFIELIVELSNSQTEALFMALLEEQCLAVDIVLLNKIMELSQKESLCVIQATAYHSHNIEERLLSQYKGFKKDTSCSMTLSGLIVGNLQSIAYPPQIPDNFMTEKLEQFITDDIVDTSTCIIS